MVSFDPVALEKGATALNAKDGVFRGHASTVANLAGLGTAFGEVGVTMWQGFADTLEVIRRQLEAVDGTVTTMGTMMGATGNAVTTVDQDHDNVVRNLADPAGR